MKKATRTLSLILCILMCISLFPAIPVFAEEEDEIADMVDAVSVPEIAEELPAPAEEISGEEKAEQPETEEALPDAPEEETVPDTEEAVSAEEDEAEGEELVEEETAEGAELLAATSGTCGANVTWELNGGTLTISGTGKMYDYEYYPPWDSNLSSIKTIVINNGVTNIGSGAFVGCSNLTSVTIGNSVTSIGYDSFRGCSNLTSVTIPDSVTSIYGNAFYKCGLISVTIGNSVTSIGISAFSGCSNLLSIEVSSGNNNFCSINGVLFSKDGKEIVSYPSALQNFTIPDGVTSIGDNVFAHSRLASITIPDSVTSIGDDAFAGCTNLSSITIPNGVTYLGAGAFNGCSSLSSITIPNSVTEILEYTFYDCSNLKSITIPNSVTSIRYDAFDGCSKLTDVYYTGSQAEWKSISILYNNDPLKNATIHYNWSISGNCGTNVKWELYGDTLTVSGTGAMENYYSSTSAPWNAYKDKIRSVVIKDGVTGIGHYAFYGCSKLTSVTLGSGVKSIGQYAFASCSALPSVSLPSSVTDIGKGAFMSCASLQSITLPEGLTEMEDYLFTYCSSLTSVTIPSTVAAIGSYAFQGCGALSSVKLPNSVKEIGAYAFSATGLATVTIPDGVTAISNYCFYNCASLTGVTIPKSVKSIGDSAFYQCNSLADVYFTGSEAEWSAVTVGPANTKLKSANFHFDWGTGPNVILKANFAQQMYLACLGREPSEEDKESVVWQLENGWSGVEVARNFIFSDEFSSKNYCDYHFVVALYEAFMGREPREEEIANWVWRLQQGDRREDVFNDFATSNEFGSICNVASINRGEKIEISGGGTRPGGYCSVEGCTERNNVCEFVKRLYTVCLDREPKQNEIDAWHYYLVHGDHTGTTAAKYFVFSKEFRSHNYSNTDFVRHLYRALMGREPDAEGLKYWVWLLGEGTSREDAFAQFAAKDEFKVICKKYGVIHS